MAAEVSSSQSSRPGSDATNPHQDLYIPPSRLSLSLASDPRRSGNDGSTATGTNVMGNVSTVPAYTPQFGSVEFWTRREQADVERGAPLQAASIHRAAEVARWEWVQAHRTRLEREKREDAAHRQPTHAGYSFLPSFGNSYSSASYTGSRSMPWRQAVATPQENSFASSSSSSSSPPPSMDVTASGPVTNPRYNAQTPLTEGPTLPRPYIDETSVISASEMASLEERLQREDIISTRGQSNADFQRPLPDRTTAFSSRPSRQANQDTDSIPSLLRSSLPRHRDQRSATARETHASRFLASGGTLHDDLTAWNHLCRDLATAAGISPDEDGQEEEEVRVASTSSLSSRSMLPFGIDAGPRGLPHPIWGRRYLGPAGTWLRAELLARGREAAGVRGSDSVTPASALANEWRATVRNARTAVSGGSGVAASRPADRTTDAPPAATSSAARRLSSVGLADEAAPSQTSAMPRHPTSVAGTPNANTSLGLPAAALVGSLTDPWAASPARNNESLRPPPTLISPTPPLPLTAPIGSGRPPHPIQSNHPSQTPAMQSSGNEPLPESAFHVPAAAASPPQRTAAAEEVARLARSARAMRENLRNNRQSRRSGVAEPSASASISTNLPTSTAATSAHGQRISDGNGMRLLRRLRALDGLEDRRTDRSEAGADDNRRDTVDVSPVESVPRPHELFPWYSPPSDSQAPPWIPSPRSHSAVTGPIHPRIEDSTNLDPDGDAIGRDWYRGVRARMQSSLAEAAAQAGVDDPNGERVNREALIGDDAGISTNRHSGRRARGRGDDAEADEEGAARRQRNRTALVIADGAGAASSPNPWLTPATATAPRNVADGWTLVERSRQRPPSPQMPPSPIRATRDEGSDNVTMWFRGPSRNPRFSTSPSSMEASRSEAPGEETSETSLGESRSRPISGPTSQLLTAEASAAADPRTVRRPQRLRSLNEDDLVLASGNLGADDLTRPSEVPQQAARSNNEPRPIPTWSSLARRAEYWGSGQRSSSNSDVTPSALQAISSAPNLSVFDLHRDTPIDELRSRQRALWHASQAELATSRASGNGIVADVMTDEPEEVAPRPLSLRVDPDSTTSPMHRSSTTAPAVQDRMADVSNQLEAELREREEELRASAERLTEELARRRARIDELRQREGRIGRVLGHSEAALRRVQEMQSSTDQTSGIINNGAERDDSSSAATPAGVSHSRGEGSSAEPVSQTRSQPMASASLVRRRTLRDSAPQLRGPRAPRGGFNYLERTAETSREMPAAMEGRTSAAPLMRRSASSSSLSLSTSSTGLEKDEDQRRSTLQSPGPAVTSRRCLDDSILASPLAAEALLLSHPPLRSLITAEDQSRLDPTSTLIVEAMDSAGHHAYRDAVLSAHRRRLENWSPPQTSLPSSTMEASYPLRFEISRQMRSGEPSHQEGTSATAVARMRNVLRNDESSVTFDASRGTEVVLRFLAAMTQPGSSRDPAASAGSLTTTRTPLMASLTAHDEDVSPLSGPSMSRAEEERAWSAARARLMAGSSDAATSPSTDDATEGSLPAIEATTPQLGPSSPLASPPIGGSEAPTAAANMLQIPRGLTDRETSVIRRILALRGTASTVAERFSQFSRLSNDDIAVIRGLAIRAALPPGFFAIQNQPTTSSPREGVAEVVDAVTVPVNVASSASDADPLPSRILRPDVPSLLFTEPLPLTDEQLALVKELSVQACPREGARPTSSAQILSFMDKDKVDRFIAFRAQSFAQAATHRASAEGSDSQGPVFALSSLVIKVRESSCLAQGQGQEGDRTNESGTDTASADPVRASGTASQQTTTSRPPTRLPTRLSVEVSRREPKKVVHALVFFSISPITQDQLAEWDNVSKTDAIRYLRTLKRERYSRLHENGNGATGRLEPWEIDRTQGSAEEDRDLGDPNAVARRREEMRREDEEGLQRLLDAREAAGGSRCLPQLRPAAVFPIDLSRGGAIVNLEQEGLRTHGDVRQRRQRPIGRYLAIKILAGDGDGLSAERSGSGEGCTPAAATTSQGSGAGSAAATQRCIDLFYIGVRGWPATGTGSLDGRWHD